MRNTDMGTVADRARRAQFAVRFTRFQQAQKAVDYSLRHFIREQCDTSRNHRPSVGDRRSSSAISCGDVFTGRPRDFWEEIERVRLYNASILSTYRWELGDAGVQQ